MKSKRAIDVCLSSMGLVLLAPLLLLIALSVLATLGRPALFRQKRTGLRGREITILKFRTMRMAGSAAGAHSSDAARLTRLGSLLRTTSLDELPQLWSVIKGDMSLVGPRPLLMEYVPRYDAFQRLRLEVKPGITGWAQVNGRNGLSWERKFELDVWYVEHRSFWLDLKILALTVWQVLRGQGVSQPGYATMPEFLGSQAGGSTEAAS